MPDALLPDGLREFDDAPAIRKNIYDYSLKSLSSRFPIEDDDYRIDLVNPRYDGPQDFTLAEQKKALLTSGYLKTPVRGTLRLTHKPTNAMVEEREEVVANVPYYSDRGTLVHNGSEYSLLNQSRLRPGVFTRKKRSGEIETQFNVEPGKGKGFRMFMDPSTGVFKLNIGQSSIPAYPLLKTMGATDNDMVEAWGKEMWGINSTAKATGALKKTYERLAGYKADLTANDQVMEQYLRDELPKFALDSDVVQRTMGLKDKKGVDRELLLRATQKMLNVSRGDEEADDRDAPQFKTYMGPEDLFKERIDRDAGRLTKNLLWKVKRAKSLKPFQRGMMSQYFESMINGSGLALPLEESNSLHYLEQMNRVTGFGEGGIGSSDAITDEARDVNPNQLGFIGTVEGPECFTGDAFVFTKSGWVRWDMITGNELFACNISGRLEFHRPERLVKEPYTGVMYGAKSQDFDFLVTPGHRLYKRASYSTKGAFTWSTAEKEYNKAVAFPTDHSPYIGNYVERITLPPFIPKNGDKYVDMVSLPTEEFCELVGWVLSEGSLKYYTTVSGEERCMSVSISQCAVASEDNYARIGRLLDTLGIPYSKDSRAYAISHPQIVDYFSIYTEGAYNKWIPEMFFDLHVEARKRLLEGLILGDGRLNKTHCTYCSVSERLSLDVQRLMISLGYSTNFRIEKDNRDHVTTTNYCACLLKTNVRVAKSNNTYNYWYKTDFSGTVYCATVPGGMLLTRRGRGVGFWSGNSEKIGVDARFAYGTYKGNDGRIYGKFNDAKTGKEKFLRPEDVASMTLGFSNMGKYKDDDYVTAIRNGKTTRVLKSEVDVVLPSLARQFSQGVNLNNMPTGMQAGRQFYAAKFITQFLPLKESEAPLVDTVSPDGKSTFREYYGRKSATLKSPVNGTVVKVTDDLVTIKDAEGKEHSIDAVKYFPFNRLSHISYFPTVKEGDNLTKGDMVARSNYTDANGSINLGRNLKVAMIPARGESHDDAIVLSETAANKMATERLYGFDLEAKHGVEMGRDKYMSLFPKKFTNDQFNTLDEHGIVKAGTKLNKGDPIIVGIGPKLMTAADAQLGKLHKTLRNTFTDKAVLWEHDYEGQVVDSVAIRGGRAGSVNVVCAPPVQQGDKLSSDFAIKGVVGKIVADDQMPQDQATGEAYEIMFNPMAILSRVSPNQIASMAVAKVAKSTGQQVRIPQEAPEEGWAQWSQNLLDKHGLKATADIFDPESGKTIKDIGDGYAYVQAFHHLSEKKLSARGGSGGYDISEQPAKGGFEGAKRFSGLDLGAALGHGVPHVIKDALGIRGTKNEDFWKTLRSGNPLPKPQIPFIYTKFLNTLRAGGVNVIENGSKTKILPMTDRDVDKLAPDALDSSDMLDDDFKPRAGGLFDPGLTGGVDGLRFTHIKLDEPVPNPVMEEPVRRVLGLRVKDLENILAGTQDIDGKTGGAGVKEALSKIDTDKLMEQCRMDIKSKRGAARDNAIKVYSYLDSAKTNNIALTDWMVQKIPVLPPKFRPIARMGDMALTADLNELYRDLIETRNNVRELQTTTGASGMAEDKINIYNAVKAAYGLGDPITPEGQSKHLKGALWQVVGDRPKTGMFQRQVMSKTVDNVARGVITPDPNLDMDTVGIPEDAAWSSYKDFVIRRLSRKGYPMIKAMEMVEKRDGVARDALNSEMAERPVIMDRAPTWHKFNLMAFYPVITNGKNIKISPLVGKGFNADFDGDTMSMHVPVSDKAVEEAKRKMLPSSNLFTATTMRDPSYTPKMEMTLGLYQLTQEPSNKPVKRFANAQAARVAYKKGEIRANDPIEIG